ncbi:MAG: YoaK family protein [Solirubrobacterales bacterium]
MTFVTGMVDAVSFLALGSVFTANMTGNIVLLGFGIAGTGGLEVIGPLISLGMFALGACLGGILGFRLADRHPRHMLAAIGCEVWLVGAAAVFAAVVDVRANDPTGDAVIALLALAMGVRTATSRRLGVPDLTTTVVTLSVAGLAADSKLAGGSGEGSARRVAAASAVLVGAVAGALLLRISVAFALALAAGFSLVTLLLYLRAGRGHA